MRTVMPIAALLCGSCASTTDVLSRAPSEVVTSDKHYIDVAACIGDLNNMPVQERSDGSRVVAIKAMTGNVGAVYTIKPNGDGALVEVRQPGIMDISKYKRCL
ncbi:MAG TPA: hypothetical protein PKD99_02380 [Sphingopyxis sp.]|nr:hypothetical protein [Sphingopyxis sp.]HMP43924.1 hypothetical protein [Sphingopyxis sp.]HMQ18091.1 hypothetical protein [Sphingopyxis sp.]